MRVLAGDFQLDDGLDIVARIGLEIVCVNDHVNTPQRSQSHELSDGERRMPWAAARQDYDLADCAVAQRVQRVVGDIGGGNGFQR